MAGSYILSDEYVAGLLAKEANVRSIKYSAMGLQALLPDRSNGRAPKPNTRFLRNVLRETDSHNAALLAKEREDAKGRLKTLVKPKTRRSEEEDRQTSSNGKRQMQELIRHVKRRRLSESDGEERQRRKDRRGKASHTTSRSSTNEINGERSRRHRRSEDNDITEDDEGPRRHHRRSGHRDKHSRHEDRPLRRRRRRSRSPSSSRSRSRSASPYRSNRSHKASRRRKRSLSSPPPSNSARPQQTGVVIPAKKLSNSAPKSYPPSSDSDPLESLIGPPAPPAPPRIQSKGRGTFGSRSAIDTHFSATYDPSVDVRPPSDSEDNWDQAIEAFRDRQKWKQQGAERLKLAGFTEEQVRKWERSGGGDSGEGDVEGVRWRARGEGREWDRGKVVEEDGLTTLRPEWGRLKGT